MIAVYYDDAVVYNVRKIEFIEDYVNLFDSIGNLLITLTRDQLVKIELQTR